MAHVLTQRDVNEIATVLSSTYVVDVCGGAGRIITAPLPGKAVCAIQAIGDMLFFVIDLEKPLAYRHARQMIREWRAGYVEPVVAGDGTVQLVPLPSLPEPDGKRPCNLSHVS